MADTPYPLPRQTRESAILVGNGTVGPYGPSLYKVFDTADVKVFAKVQGAQSFSDVTASVTVTKTGALEFDTFSVTFNAPVLNTTSWYHQAARVAERSIAVVKGGTLDTPQLEKELSKQATAESELRRDVDRAARFEPGQPVSPIPPGAPNLLLGFNNAGTKLELKTPAGIAGEVLPAAASTLLVRNAGNTAFEPKTPAQVRALQLTAPYVATKTILKGLDVNSDGLAYDKANREWFMPFALTDVHDTTLGVSYANIAAVDGEGIVRTSTFDATKGWVRQSFLRRQAMQAYWFDMYGDGSVSGADMYTRMGYSWEVMKLIKRALRFPGGTFKTSGQLNLPFRQGSVVSLLQVDAGIIAQPDTVFMTSAPNGADVFQLNGLSHFFIRGRPLLKSEITGGAPTQGSNGVSLTNGCEEIDVDVACLNLPAIDKGTNLDGGSGGSIQMGTTGLACGRVRMKVRTKGCGHGFSYAGTPTTMATKKLDAHIEVHSEDGYRSAVVSNGALTGAVDDTFADGLTIEATSVNDQQGLVLGRSFGGDFRIALNSNKTAAAKRLMPDGVTQWRGTGTPDTTVLAVRALMGHKSRIISTGKVGACDYIYEIGGATSGDASQNGHSEQLWMHMGVAGAPATAAILITDAGGNTVRNSHFEIDPKSVNRASLPAQIVDGTKGNTYRMLDGLRDGDHATNSSDGNVTLAPTSDVRNQLFTGTLTADRTITLSNSGAARGQEWEILRTGGGNFQLIIGAIGALGTGEGMLVRYDGAAWYVARRWRVTQPQGTDIVDADITLNPHAHASKQLQSTALTADRTVTLGTTNAVAGDEFDIRRSTTAGAFRLIITGLGSLGPGEYLRAVYSGAGWVVGDRGVITETFTTIATDQAETINPHAQGRMIAHTGTLSADRTITLSTAGVGAGDMFYIKRTGGGAFNLSIGGLKNLATNQWCIVRYSGGAWVLFAFGSL